MATATYQVTPPEAFSFNTPFERFRSASGLSDRTAITQVNTLIYTMGPEADDIFHSFTLSFTLSEDEKGVVKGKFNSHFVKRTNVETHVQSKDPRGGRSSRCLYNSTLCSSGEVRIRSLEGGDDQRQDCRRHT